MEMTRAESKSSGMRCLQKLRTGWPGAKMIIKNEGITLNVAENKRPALGNSGITLNVTQK
jgi:hypothetical protein